MVNPIVYTKECTHTRSHLGDKGLTIEKPSTSLKGLFVSYELSRKGSNYCIYVGALL